MNSVANGHMGYYTFPSQIVFFDISRNCAFYSCRNNEEEKKNTQKSLDG